MARPLRPEPTQKMLDVLHYIMRYVEENSYQPTYEEIGEHLMISKNAVVQRLKGLAARDIIRFPGSRERAIKILPSKYTKGFKQ